MQDLFLLSICFHIKDVMIDLDTLLMQRCHP